MYGVLERVHVLQHGRGQMQDVPDGRRYGHDRQLRCRPRRLHLRGFARRVLCDTRAFLFQLTASYYSISFLSTNNSIF